MLETIEREPEMPPRVGETVVRGVIPRLSGVMTLFYYDDVAAAARWYAANLDFEKVIDYDWLTVFRVVDRSYLGLVAAGAGSQRPVAGANKGAMISIETTDLDKWHDRFFRAGVAGTGRGLDIGCDGQSIEFKVQDPGGYTVEFFEWIDPPIAWTDGDEQRRRLLRLLPLAD